MSDQLDTLLFIKTAFILFLLLLSCDHLHKFFALILRTGTKARVLVPELTFARGFQVRHLAEPPVPLGMLPGDGATLFLFESSLHFLSDEFGLAIADLFLKGALESDFFLPLGVQSHLLVSMFDLLGNLLQVPFVDPRVLGPLNLEFLSSVRDSDTIARLNFSVQRFCPLNFYPLDGAVLLTHLFNILKHLYFLHLKGLDVSLTLDLSFNNLRYDDLTPFLGCHLSDSLALSLSLEVFQSFNLHHSVELPLFTHKFIFHVFVLHKLLITDRSDFAVEDHSIHTLNVIFLFIEHGKGAGPGCLQACQLVQLKRLQGCPGRLLPIMREHELSMGLGSCFLLI